MAKREEATRKATSDIEDCPICGVIMPISATVNHSEQHWLDVQTLLHRVIENAGFEAKNVWESVLTDRVSERIIGNIFQVPIAVADISDLNPNVMLELGLRLASKKPTIVIVNSGGEIPFDIRDFHALFYPSNLNILEMEDFFKKITKLLNEKYKLYKAENYQPFLGNVIVDVASPETREVGANQIIMERLDSLATEIRRLDRGRSSYVPASQNPTRFNGSIAYRIPELAYDNFYSEARPLWEVDHIVIKEVNDGMVSGLITFSGATSMSDVYDKIEKILINLGGEIDVPF